MDFIKSIKNKIDFGLRNTLRFSLKVSAEMVEHPHTLQLQNEFASFLDLINWKDLLNKGQPLKIVDVGTRTFLYAPVFETFFEEIGFAPVEVHGYEIDAYRRFTNLRSRADYGFYYASKLKMGHFHPTDFLRSDDSFDLVFLLNPFVTPSPLLSWGLPLSNLKSQEIFGHCTKSLKNHGILVVSSPNEEEFEICHNLTQDLNLKYIDQFTFRPPPNSPQQQPRHTLVLQKVAT